MFLGKWSDSRLVNTNKWSVIRRWRALKPEEKREPYPLQPSAWRDCRRQRSKSANSYFIGPLNPQIFVFKLAFSEGRMISKDFPGWCLLDLCSQNKANGLCHWVPRSSCPCFPPPHSFPHQQQSGTQTEPSANGNPLSSSPRDRRERARCTLCKKWAHVPQKLKTSWAGAGGVLEGWDGRPRAAPRCRIPSPQSPAPFAPHRCPPASRAPARHR